MTGRHRGVAGLSGVYVVFGPRGIYVGESAQILDRLRYVVMCGFDWSVLRYMPGASRRERQQWERRYMTAYRKLGLPVVSRINGEWASEMLLRLSPAERRDRARRAMAARKLTSAQQAEYGRKSAGGGSRIDKLPKERRHELSRLGIIALSLLPPDRRHEIALSGGHAARDQFTPEERSDRARRGWITRRAMERSCENR